MLTRDAILGAKDLKRIQVQVPEWGGEVYISEISAKERDAYEGSINDGKRINLLNVRARLVVKCLTDDAGKRLFTDADAEQLGDKNGKVLDRLWELARQINGIGGEAIEAEKKD